MSAAQPLAEIQGTAAALAALLRLLARAHEDLADFNDQAAVAWLLPVAERMAADIAAVAEDAQKRPPPSAVE